MIQPVVKPTTGLTTGWMFVYTMQPVVQPVVQLISRLYNRFDNRLDVCIHDTTCCPTQPVVSCIQTFNRLPNRFVSCKRGYRVYVLLEETKTNISVKSFIRLTRKLY